VEEYAMRVRQSHFAMAAVAAGLLGAGTCAASAASADTVKLISQNCQQCHEIKGIPDFGNIGPSLIGLKDRYPNRKDVEAIIYDETKRNPQTVMLPFGRNLILTNKEIDDIVDYLYAQ
jgi:sulfur-oxidizing protein SoxX